MAIKVRPDLYFPDQSNYFDAEVIANEAVVYCENKDGWIFREWGFGIGDQLIYGHINNMVRILGLHGEGRLSQKITKIISSQNLPYAGHVNCGLETWLTAAECHVSKVRPTKICSIKKLNISEAKKIFEVKSN